jgi:hypothetical protein
MASFLKSESGAVTVDWTVMTAAVVGLGMASAAAVRLGTGDLAGQVQASLSNSSVASLGLLGLQLIVSQNFGDGNLRGWSRGETIVFGEWGPMLGPFGGADTHNNPVSYGVTLPEGTHSALISFDLVIADSWDGMVGQGRDKKGEGISLLVNGEQIAFERFTQLGHANHNDLRGARQSTIEIGGTTYDVRMTPQDLPTDSVGGWVRPDQRWSVQVQAQNPASNFQLGFSANLDQSQQDESFGIQNFNIYAQ